MTPIPGMLHLKNLLITQRKRSKMTSTNEQTQRAHLNTRLHQFQGQDDLEKGYLVSMMDLLQANENPFSRHHFVPGHFTASAFVLSPDRNALLLIYHSKLHRWLQPGGHIDPQDRDVYQSACREVLEETGISDIEPVLPGIFDVDIHAIPPLRRDPEHKHYDLRFLFRATTLDCCAGSDAKDARWFPLPQINEVESDPSVMRAVGKIQRMFL